VFQIFENSFVKKFELYVEAHLHDRGSRPYWHCLTVMKAIRLVMRLNLDPFDGSLRWSAAAKRFTQDDTAMIRHHELLAVCHKFKPAFTINQMRRALTVLKDYGLIWSCPGRPKATSRFADQPGTVMYLRVNTGRLSRALRGELTLSPVRLSLRPGLNAPIGATVLTLERMTSEMVADGSKTSKTVPETQEPGSEMSEDFLPSWAKRRGAPASSPRLSTTKIELTEDEKHLIEFMTTTAGLFRGTDGWSHDCGDINELTVAQLARVRLHMKAGLTLAFMRDYADFVININASNSPDGKVPWWANCTIDFFLAAFRRIRAEAQRRRREMICFQQEFQSIDIDKEFLRDVQIYCGFTPGGSDVDLASLSRGLGHNLSCPAACIPEQRRLWDEQDAYKGMVAVIMASRIPGDTLRYIANQTRPQVVAWLRRNPHQAERLCKIPNFRFWFNLPDKIMLPIFLEAAHNESALRAGRELSRWAVRHGELSTTDKGFSPQAYVHPYPTAKLNAP